MPMLKVGRLRGLHKQHCITTSRGSAYKTVAIAILAMASSTVPADETGALRQELHMERQKLAEQMQKLEQQAAIHAYSAESIMNAIEAGVRSSEHALFASEEAMRLMKERDLFFSTQFLAFSLTPEQPA